MSHKTYNRIPLATIAGRVGIPIGRAAALCRQHKIPRVFGEKGLEVSPETEDLLRRLADGPQVVEQFDFRF